MPSIVKPLSTEVSVTTANTVSGATLVRAYAATEAVVTIADDQAAVRGTFTVPAGRVEYIEKFATDTIASTAALLCTSIAYNG